jgi:lipoate-protein ligase B
MNLENIIETKTSQVMNALKEVQDIDIDAIAIDIGTINYPDLFEIEKLIAEEKYNNSLLKDVILFAEHEPCIDFSRKAKNNWFVDPILEKLDPYLAPHLVREYLSSHKIKFTISQRAGGPSYLGPGQLIVHPIVNCKSAGIMNAPLGQHKLDLIMKRTAFYLGVPDVETKDHTDNLDKRDIYLSPSSTDKAGTLGMKLGSKIAQFKGLAPPQVMFNGFALFINREATHGFSFIPACGYSHDELTVGSIQEVLEDRGLVNGQISLQKARETALRSIKEIFGYKSEIIRYDQSQMLKRLVS